MSKIFSFSRTHSVCWLLLVIFIASSALFLLYGVKSHFVLILKLRLVKWLGLVLIGVAIGVATLLFQSITQNNILTPSIIGFDALFVLLQTSLLFVLGGTFFASLDPMYSFFSSLTLMSIMSVLLFAPLIRNLDLVRLLLVGIIFSILFRSITGFLQRLIAPDEYLILQSAIFANFNAIPKELLSIASVVILVLLAITWKLRHVLDVLMLGRTAAIGLGVNYQRYSYMVLVIVALFVATATALVGPMSFLGLLVCALSNQFAPSMHHGTRIIVVTLVSATTLILGQALFEHLLNMKSTLSVVVDSLGGILFLLLLRQRLKTTH